LEKEIDETNEVGFPHDEHLNTLLRRLIK